MEQPTVVPCAKGPDCGPVFGESQGVGGPARHLTHQANVLICELLLFLLLLKLGFDITDQTCGSQPITDLEALS